MSKKKIWKYLFRRGYERHTERNILERDRFKHNAHPSEHHGSAFCYEHIRNTRRISYQQYGVKEIDNDVEEVKNIPYMQKSVHYIPPKASPCTKRSLLKASSDQYPSRSAPNMMSVVQRDLEKSDSKRKRALVDRGKKCQQLSAMECHVVPNWLWPAWKRRTSPH